MSHFSSFSCETSWLSDVRMPPTKSCEIVAAAFSVVSGPYKPMPERPHLACAMRTIMISWRPARTSQGVSGAGL